MEKTTTTEEKPQEVKKRVVNKCVKCDKRLPKKAIYCCYCGKKQTTSSFSRPIFFWGISGFLIFSFTIVGFTNRHRLIHFRRNIWNWSTRSNAIPERDRTDFGVTLPEYSIHGIDVSHYQQKILWDEVKKMKVDNKDISFVFIKATEGKNWQDTHFSENWKEAKEQGFLVGAYHYYKPNVTSSEQASNFIKMVKLSKGDLPPVLDVEEKSHQLSTKRFKLGVKNTLDLMEKHYGVKPILYIPLNYYNSYFKNDASFKGYHFWIANYYQTRLRVKKDNWHFWQHHHKGRVNGIAGYVDMNVFNGNIEELKKLCVK